MSGMPTPPLPGNLPDTTTVKGPGSGSGMDRVKSLLNRLTGGGMTEVQKQLDVSQQQRLADAQLHQKNYNDLSQVITLDADKDIHDADGNLTPKGQLLEMQRRTAFDAWQKAAGVNKESKSVIQKMGEVTDHIVHHRQADKGMPVPPQVGSPANGAASPPGAGGGMPAPPSSSGPSGSTAAAPTAAAAPLNPQAVLGQQMASIEQRRAIERAKGLDVAKAEVEGEQPKRFKQGLVDAGFSEEEATRMTRAKFLGVAGRPKMSKVSYTDPSDPTRTLFGLQDENPYSPGFGSVIDTSGNEVANPGKIVPAMLPSQATTTYNADTGVTAHSVHKVAPSTTGVKGAGSTATPSKSAVPSATSVRTPPTTGSGSSLPATPGGRIPAMAQDWHDNGVAPAAKDKPQVQKYMSENNIEPGVKPTPKEIGLRDDIKKVEPMVDRLEGFLTQNGMTQSGQGGMFSLSAWKSRAETEKAWKEYSAGIPPHDKKLGELIKMAASIKIMGAAPWMSLGRGKYLYSEIVQHLPEPTDTPAQLYEKVVFYRNVLEDAKQSLPPALQGKMAAPPGGATIFSEGSKHWTIPPEHVQEFKKDHPNAVTQ